MESNMPLNPVPKGVKWANRIMLALNVLGAAGYLCFVTYFLSLTPQDRAMGIEDTMGPPMVWFMFVAEIFAFQLILNLTWGGFIVAYRYFRGGRLWLLGGRLWLLTAMVWIVALLIDIGYQRGDVDWFVIHLKYLCQ